MEEGEGLPECALQSLRDEQVLISFFCGVCICPGLQLFIALFVVSFQVCFFSSNIQLSVKGEGVVGADLL